MRKLLCLGLIVASFSIANAQSPSNPPANPPSWARVQGLPVGTAVTIKTHNAKNNCVFQSASEADLKCSGTVYPKADIRYVKQRHRGRSTLAGLAIGAGAGALLGTPLGQSGSFVGHGAAAAIVAIPGAIIGAIVGASTDFTHTTIYRAP